MANNEYKKAQLCLKRVLSITPDMLAAHYEMGQLFERTGQPVMAIKAYRHCLKIKPDHLESLLAYSKLMARKGCLDKSAWTYRRLLLQAPENAGLKHLLKANVPGDVQGGADEQYVKDVFDDYADRFDEHLVNGLSYHVPEKLGVLFNDTIKKAKDLNIIDLGCGTGLCGPLFRPYAKQLTGVDLSAGMLKKADERDCYDKLLNCDLVEGLKKYHGTLDLAIAADVLVYVGELADVFAACFMALKTAGYLMFSVESTTSPKGLVLKQSGRYQHSMSYITKLLEKHHFSLVKKEVTEIRTEGNEPVMGVLYLARKEKFSPLT